MTLKIAISICLAVSFPAPAQNVDSLVLRAPLNGWLSSAAKWTANAESETAAAEGRVRQLPAISEEALPFLSATGEDTNLVIRLESPGAVALRVHFENFHLPEGALVYVYGIDAGNRVTQISGPYKGAGPLGTGKFWARPVPGATAVVEVQLPEEIANLPFTLREVAIPESYEGWAEATISRSSETRTSIFRGMAITHDVVDGIAIAGGDMVLGRADELEPYTEGKVLPSRESVAITGSNYRWPGGIVPYTVSPTLPNSVRVLIAVLNWNYYMPGVITLVPRTTETDYVNFVNPSSPTICNSYVGRRGGVQVINLGDYCNATNAIHEIGHAVGLWHEHTRSDRDSYVKVLWENVDPTLAYNFSVQSNSVNTTPYDYNSVMHYPNYTFSKNGLPTLQTIPPGIPIGQGASLSSNDVVGVKAIYSGAPAPPPPPSPAQVQITFSSNPSGLPVTIDGTQYTAPVTKSFTAGQQAAIAALVPAANAGTRYSFSSWSDGGAQSHTYTVPSSATTITANYAAQYQLSVGASPANIGATVASAPASLDGFYNPGSTVGLSATAPFGYCFTGWSGILNVANTITSVVLGGPLTVSANFSTGGLVLPSWVMVAGSATTAQVALTSTAGCVWKVTPASPWITVTTPSGSGSGTIGLGLQKNTTGLTRFGVIQINNQYVFIVQLA
ncbi:MAG: hypothetical protein HYZ37_01890 [Candidatus Solibacter usitatus]|nr:hypothetical protein [Candidatus Solibacter usitatus]